MHGEKPDVFPYDHFVSYFPQYAPPANECTPEFVTSCGNRAALYMADMDSVWLFGPRRTYAFCLLAAHIIYITKKIEKETAQGASGAAGAGEAAVGPVTSASVGGVSVSMQTPSSSNDGPFEWWLNKSPYGQEFLAMIRTRGPMMTFINSMTPVLPLR